jgi:hypothetical protein
VSGQHRHNAASLDSSTVVSGLLWGFITQDYITGVLTAMKSGDIFAPVVYATSWHGSLQPLGIATIFLLFSFPVHYTCLCNFASKTAMHCMPRVKSQRLRPLDTGGVGRQW